MAEHVGPASRQFIDFPGSKTKIRVDPRLSASDLIRVYR